MRVPELDNFLRALRVVGAAAVLMLLTSCDKVEEPIEPPQPPAPPAPPIAPPAPPLAPPAQPSASADFRAGKLKFDHGEPFVDEYVDVRSIVGTEDFKIVVLATWCPFSKKFLQRASSNSSLAREYSLFLVYENEFKKAVEREVEQGRQSEMWATETMNSEENVGRMFVDPDLLRTTTIPIYVIKGGTLSEVVDGFPERISCSGAVCQESDVTTAEYNMLDKSDFKD